MKIHKALFLLAKHCSNKRDALFCSMEGVSLEGKVLLSTLKSKDVCALFLRDSSEPNPIPLCLKENQASCTRPEADNPQYVLYGKMCFIAGNIYSLHVAAAYKNDSELLSRPK